MAQGYVLLLEKNSMDLYLDQPEVSHELLRKEAAFVARLKEDPANWAQELTSELYRQLPFLSDYDLNVMMDKVDEKRGMAFGYADIHNKTERPDIEHEQVGLPHIRIPLLVQDRAVKPFSIFLDGERVLPLTEDRVREILFNPSTFDLSTSAPRDPSLVEPLMPPQRSGIGMGGEYKMASALAEVGGFNGSADRSIEDLPYTVRKYKGHPDLMKKAIEIERKMLAIDKDTPPSKFPQPMPMDPADQARSNKRVKLDHERRELDLDLAARVVGKTKTAFKHISKEQWKAIYQSNGVQKAIQKYGGPHHPQVTNKVYETASKAYGYHPKVLDMKPELPAAAAGAAKAAPAAGGAAKPAAAKTASVSLLETIAPTIREVDRDAFIGKLASDFTLQADFRRSGFLIKLVDIFDEKMKTASAADRLLVLAENIAPTVTTIQKLPGGDFLVKSANVHAFYEKAAAAETVPHEEAAAAIGPENAAAMKPGQTATAVADPVEQPVEGEEEAPVSRAKIIEEFGEYKVQDGMGNQLLGWVFPRCMNFDDAFSPTDMAVFTNGSSYAVQDTVAGELVGKGANLPVEQPRGDGVFYTVEQGEGICTAPVTVRNAMMAPDGQKFVGTDVFGQEVVISLSEGLKEPMRVGDNEFALPDTWSFLRLNNQIEVASNPEEMNKAASIRAERNSVTLFFNGGYNIKGGCNIEKLSRDLRYDLSSVDAEFMLGLLGVDGSLAKQKVAQAYKKGSVKLAGLKPIQFLSERYAESEKRASVILSNFPDLRRDLIKEAAKLEDQDTIDNLLALNFLNPENLETFIASIPDLEQTGETLAEMLLYSYLGQKEIPEGPTERAMKALEEVTEQLKAIATSGS